MADPANALCTTARVKQLLGITAVTYDTQIEGIVGAVGAWADSYCGRTFIGASAVTEYFDVEFNDIRDLYVRNPPILSTGSVKEDSSSVFASTVTALTANTDYIAYDDLKNAGKYRRLGGGWLSGSRTVQIVYKGGYAAQANVPKDLAEAAANLCVFLWHMNHPSPSQRLGISAHSLDGQSVTGYLQDLPPYIREVFDRYRIGMVG